MAASMAVFNANCVCINAAQKNINPAKPAVKKTSLSSAQTLPKGLSLNSASPILTGTALAGAVFSTLTTCDPAFAAQQIATIADGDNRGLALLIPIFPALAWVLYNILQPALNQLNKMRQSKGVIVGLGLSGLAASGFVVTPESSATEIAWIAEAAGDNRGQVILFVLVPALLWVGYNILQPALNQLNKMRSQ